MMFYYVIYSGKMDGTTDTCQGDSGGSLLVRDSVLNKTKFISAGYYIDFSFFFFKKL